MLTEWGYDSQMLQLQSQPMTSAGASNCKVTHPRYRVAMGMLINLVWTHGAQRTSNLRSKQGKSDGSVNALRAEFFNSCISVVCCQQ